MYKEEFWDAIRNVVIGILVVALVFGAIIGIGLMASRPGIQVINQRCGTNYSVWQYFWAPATIRQAAGLNKQPQPAKIDAEIVLKSK